MAASSSPSARQKTQDTGGVQAPRTACDDILPLQLILVHLAALCDMCI